jgi:probable rRNA maturation factor
MGKVRFNYADVAAIASKDKTRVKSFVEELFLKENRQLQKLEYIFCSDNYLLEINKSFLQHDYFTDIITFDLSVSKDETIGEIYISVDRVRENAMTHSATFQTELLRVIFHGALHLCGYKDKKKSEITIMREKEDYYLRLFEQK